MLVTRILGACPGCGRPDAFGNVDVFGARLVRGCGYCKYSEEIPLPPIGRKKLIYLDQSFYSSAFRGGDQRFVEAAARIGEVAAKQLLAAPRSSVHDNETQLWPRRDELIAFIKRASRGAQFHPGYGVVETQLIRAFGAWRDGKPSAYVREERDAIDGDVHKWDRYFWIDVGRFYPELDALQRGKDQAVNGLLDMLDSWRASTLTFDEHVQLELREAARGYLNAYMQEVARLGAGDPMAMIDAPVIAGYLSTLMHMLPSDSPAEDRLRRCLQFLISEHFKNAPYQSLSARMFSALKESVRSGGYTNPARARKKLQGIFYDFEHVATYAPYCDAIFVDQPMAQLVAHSGVALESSYGVKVFSLQKWDELFAWLAEIEASASDEHNAALAAINTGTPWRRPKAAAG